VDVFTGARFYRGKAIAIFCGKSRMKTKKKKKKRKKKRKKERKKEEITGHPQ